jgi:hypothetical protein
MENCKICGHEEHKTGECEDFRLAEGCRCLCCHAFCTCDGKSWEYTDDLVKIDGVLSRPRGGKYTAPL